MELKNHHMGKKNTPIAYFKELINTTSSNLEMIKRVIKSGIKLGTLSRKPKSFSNEDF